MMWAAGYLFIFFIPLMVLCSIFLVKLYLWQRYTVELLGASLLKNFSGTKAGIKLLLKFFGLIMLLLALARPQWGTQEQTVSQQGRDVLIALDISRSMLAQDSLPSRLEAAKKKIRELLTQLTAERVSLMVFSGIAVVQCPFTSDMAAFLSFLDLADVEAISSGTTALDKAIDLGIKTFEAIPGRKQRLMVLFTDGEDFSTDQEVAQRAHEAGLHLFTVGVGTPEGAPIPVYDYTGAQQGHVQDQGTTVITKLNEQRLAQLAQQTGGRYIRMTKDDEDLTMLVEQIQRFEKEAFDDTTIKGAQEKYMLFAGLGLAVLLFEWIL